MKKFNFKNGKEKLVEKANNVKEKCIGYVDDYAVEILALGMLTGGIVYGSWLQRKVDQIAINYYCQGMSDISATYQDILAKNVSKESN